MKTILIVDDSPMCSEPLQALLRAEGYRTQVAENGGQAMQLLDQGAPDLVLLDLAMPVIDGISVLRRMRERPSLCRVPVIVLSGESDKARILEVARLGPRAFLLKSRFSLDRLLALVRQILSDAPLPAQPASPHAAVPGSANPTKPAGPPKAKVAAPVPPTLSRSAALGTLEPRSTRDEVLRRVTAAAEMKGFSPAVSQVMKLTANPNCSVDSVARAIGQDHAVALKILKLANSAIYTRGGPADSVQKAIVRIGLERIRQTVLNITVVERFSSGAFDRHLNAQQMWEHAIACGLITAMLVPKGDDKLADAAFTSGLLHDVGRIILAEQLGDTYVEVLERAQSLCLPLEQVESRMLGINHAEIMGTVLQHWNFPKELAGPITLHHASVAAIRAAAGPQAGDAMRLALADRLAHALMLGGSGNDTIYPTQPLIEDLQIEEETLARITAEARGQTDDLKLAMLAGSQAGVWPQRVEQLRATLAGPFRPVFVSGQAAKDAVRIFCAELAGPESQETPTIAVVHVDSADAAAGLFRQLVEREQVAGVASLPTVVIQPAPGPEAALPTDRTTSVLTAPFTIASFVSAFNSLSSAMGRAAA